MKISVISIVQSHLDTLKDYGSTRVSSQDIFLFYVLPLISAVVSYAFGLRLSKDFHNLSVTFYGIFIPLLLNIQVAVFGIFQRKWTNLEDNRLEEMRLQTNESRRKLLSEINSNISYLTLFCCLAVVLAIVFFASGYSSRIFSAVTVCIYLHFFLTVLMIIKRSHSLFQKEYNTD